MITQICKVCNGLGKTVSGYLDCLAVGCTASADRAAIEKWVDEQSMAFTEADIAWLAFQKGKGEQAERIAALETDLKQARAALLQPIVEMGELQTALERIATLESTVAEQDAMLGRRPCQNDRCVEMTVSLTRNAALEAESQKFAREAAAERLRADQGWQRYEAKNGEVNQLREMMAAQPPAVQAGQTEGWKLVPLDPTEEMLAAAIAGASLDLGMAMMMRNGLLRNWKAMLSAAPVAEQAQERE